MKGTDLHTTSAGASRKDNAVDDCGAERVLDAAAGLLGQCGRIVEAMDDASYCCASTVLAGGTIGKHLRHTLDHFNAILAGTRRNAAIDYDHRARGVAVETDRSAAMEQIGGLGAGLASLRRDLGVPVRIRVMLSADGAELELDSTVVREVAFATHHGVHHVAMMKAIAGEMGVALDDEIGRAPSTILHERGAATGRTDRAEA